MSEESLEWRVQRQTEKEIILIIELAQNTYY